MSVLPTTSHLQAIFLASVRRVPTRMVTNTLAQLVTPALRAVLGLAAVAVLSRYLGLTGFGEYALVFAYVGVFSGVLADWGLPIICLRESSRNIGERPTLVAGAASLQAVIALGTYAVMIASLFVVRYPPAVIAAIAVYGLSILLSPVNLLSVPFQADLELSRLLPASVAASILNFLLTIGVVVLHGSLLALVGVAFVSLLLQCLVVGYMSLQKLGFAFRFSTAHWSDLLREAWPLGIATIVSTALLQAPVLILSSYSLQAVGIFNAASRIPQQLMLVPAAIRMTSFPMLSEAWVNDRARFDYMLGRLLDIGVLISVPLAILGVGLAEPVTRLIFGAGFAGSATPLALMMVTLGFLVPSALLGEALVAAGLQRLNLGIMVGSFPLLLVFIATLVPGRGASGAALALLLTYLAIVTAVFLASRWRLGNVPKFSWVGRAVIGATVGVGILLLTRSAGSTLAAVCGALSSGLALFFLQSRFVTSRRDRN